MQKVSRTADGKSGYFVSQAENILITGHKQISPGLLRKVDEYSIERVMESVYGIIRAMYFACLQKGQYIAQKLFNVFPGKFEFGISKHPYEFVDRFLTA